LNESFANIAELTRFYSLKITGLFVKYSVLTAM